MSDRKTKWLKMQWILRKEKRERDQKKWKENIGRSKITSATVPLAFHWSIAPSSIQSDNARKQDCVLDAILAHSVNAAFLFYSAKSQTKMDGGRGRSTRIVVARREDPLLCIILLKPASEIIVRSRKCA